MRFATFEAAGRQSYGTVAGEHVRAASDKLLSRYPDLRSVIAADALPELADDNSGELLGVADIALLPVIPNPDKILCIGVNYRPHAEEMGRELPQYPTVFTRFSSSLVGHGASLVKPRASERYDFEGELAVIIGRPARHVSREDALDHVAGYSCFMDGSVRDWQGHTSQFTPGKNFEQSGALGPWLVARDQVADIGSVALTTKVSGEIMQRGRIDELLFDIPAIIEYCSTFCELRPGDVIATGTPGGVGAARNPPLWLNAGDVVSVDLGEIGRL
ncbi:MAG: fumarylacetoacetate hydrolase family protein [Woeseiaceae bacterium]